MNLFVGLFANKGSCATPRRGQRAEERFTTDQLTSTLGEIIDLSGSGLRVRRNDTKGIDIGKVFPVTIKSSQCQITLKSRVIRIKRTGFRQVEIGLAFVEIKPGLRNALHHLARFGFIPNLRTTAAEPSDAKSSAKPALPDFYGLLQVSPHATDAEIRAAYHQAARRYHPDADRSANRVVMFEAITRAYRVLRDPQQRRDYDDRRKNATKAA